MTYLLFLRRSLALLMMVLMATPALSGETETLLLNSQSFSLSERARYYRALGSTPQFSEDELASIRGKKVLDYMNRLDAFERSFEEHYRFKNIAELELGFELNEAELKKDLVDLSNNFVDSALKAGKGTPVSLLATPLFKFVKDEYITEVKTQLDEELNQATLQSEKLIAFDFLKQLSKNYDLDQLNHAKAQTLYNEAFSHSSIILEKGFAKKLLGMSDDEKQIAVYLALKQSVVDSLANFTSLSEAYEQLKKEFKGKTAQELELAIRSAKELSAAKSLVLDISRSASSQIKEAIEYVQIARDYYANSQTPMGELATLGALNTAKLDLAIGHLDFLTERELQRMSASELLEYTKTHGSLPDGKQLDEKNMAKLGLAAQKEKFAQYAQDVSVVGSAISQSLVALGANPELTRAVNFYVSSLAGILTICAASGPVGWVVGAATIIVAFAGLIGGAGGPSKEHKQLMSAIRYITRQLHQIQNQLIELKIIIKRQHSELIQKIESEFSKTRGMLQHATKILNLNEFRERYADCLSLEGSFNNLSSLSGVGYNLSEDDYKNFFSPTQKNSQLYKNCLASLKEIQNLTMSLRSLDHFLIYSFSEHEIEADSNFEVNQSFEDIKRSAVLKLKDNTSKKAFNESEISLVLLRLLQLPSNDVFDEIKKVRMIPHSTTNWSESERKTHQIFNRGLVSMSAIYYFTHFLSLLSQLSPYVNENGQFVSMEDKYSSEPNKSSWHEAEAASMRLKELIAFVLPYAKAATAQERLLNGSVISYYAAEKYWDLSQTSERNTTDRWKKLPNFYEGFSDATWIHSTPETTSNFLSHLLALQNPTLSHRAIHAFYTYLAEGNSDMAKTLLPAEMSLSSEAQISSLLKVSELKKRLEDAEERIFLQTRAKAPRSEIEFLILAKVRLEQELKTAIEHENDLEAVHDLKSSSRQFFIQIPGAKTNTVESTPLINASEIKNYSRPQFFKTPRLNQLAAIQATLEQLAIDHNWSEIWAEAPEKAIKMESSIRDLQ